LNVTVKVYGPDLRRFFEKKQIVKLDVSSTIDDLARRLEMDSKSKYGWSLNLLDLTILVNGKNAETLKDRTLSEGDEITILSPIGGG
jgi:molybdopterin converting factor small subunit